MATYPVSPALSAGTNATALNPTNWNTFVDNINAIGADLVDARGDGQAFPGTDHSASQSTDIDDALQAIRHMIAHATGETNWWDEPAASLKSHDHSGATKGGRIPYASIGAANERLIVLHPLYAGGLQTNKLRGAAASGSNTITVTNDVEIVSNVCRHYYQGSSGQATLQETFIAVRITLPKDFTAWATIDALRIEHKTDSVLSTDCHIDFYVYKSGDSSVIAFSENVVNVLWSNTTKSGANMGSWSAGDILELYIRMESRNNNAVKIGAITLSYTS